MLICYILHLTNFHLNIDKNSITICNTIITFLLINVTLCANSIVNSLITCNDTRLLLFIDQKPSLVYS
jgi:hypothetical protein